MADEIIDPILDDEVKQRNEFFAKERIAEKRAKELEVENRALKDRERAMRDASLSENERLMSQLKEQGEQLRALDENFKIAQKQALVARIAGEYQLPSHLSSRLIGDTESELRTDAQFLASQFKREAVGPSFQPVNPQSIMHVEQIETTDKSSLNGSVSNSSEILKMIAEQKSGKRKLI